MYEQYCIDGRLVVGGIKTMVKYTYSIENNIQPVLSVYLFFIPVGISLA